MKKILIYCICALSFFLIFGSFIFDLVTNSNELTQTEITESWSSRDFKEVSISKNDFIKGAIRSFDISENGEIILCLENNRIVIMDVNGNVSREFSYKCVGRSSACWNGENILLYLSRAQLCIEISKDGQLVDMKDVSENDSYNQIKIQQIKSGDYTYKIENISVLLNPLTDETYSQLVKIDANGNKVTLYNAHNTQILRIVIIALFLFAFGALAVLVLLRVIKKQEKSTTQPKNPFLNVGFKNV